MYILRWNFSRREETLTYLEDLEVSSAVRLRKLTVFEGSSVPKDSRIVKDSI